MNTQIDQATYYQQFKSYCQQMQLEMSAEQLIAWDQQTNQSRVTSTLGSAQELQQIGLLYMARLWINHYSTVTLASDKPVTFATVRKTTSGMKPLETMPPCERTVVQQKMERHIENSLVRAAELGSNQKKLIDVVVQAVVVMGIDINTLLNYVTESYHRATQPAGAVQETAVVRPVAVA
jgi:hypothetical protein